MMRRFWGGFRVVVALVFLWMVTVAFGGRIEQALSPIIDDVRVDQAHVTRTADLACWSWYGYKNRRADVENVDVFLERPKTHDRLFPEVKDGVTGNAWHRGGSREPGGRDHKVCVEIPKVADPISPGEPLIVKMRLWFDGALPLYEVPITLPDVVIPGVPNALTP